MAEHKQLEDTAKVEAEAAAEAKAKSEEEAAENAAIESKVQELEQEAAEYAKAQRFCDEKREEGEAKVAMFTKVDF